MVPLKRKIQLKLYQCLEHPKTYWHVIFHLFIFCYVLLTLCLSAIMSLDEERGKKLDRVVFGMEAALGIYFTAEFILRLWAVGINSRYHGFVGRLRYATRFISIIDMLIVAASLLLLVFGSKGGHYLSGPAVQNLRFLQILRMLHVDRRATTWRIMEKVLRLHKTELITAFYLSMLGLLVTSTLVYITEGYYTDQGNQGAFNNYGDAIWWGVVTLFTIGYGDIVPKYWVSKLITCIFAITCISLFTLTSSIIGVGLALMVQEKSRKKHIKRQTPLAARVIQTYWREKMLSERFEKIPHFKYTLTQRLIAHELTPFEEAASQRRGTAAKIVAPLSKFRNMKGNTTTVHKGTGGGSSRGGQSLFGLIDSIKIKVGTHNGATTINGLNLSLTNAQSSRVNNRRDSLATQMTDDEQPSSTPATVHKAPPTSIMRGIIPKNVNNLLISHILNPALGPRLYRSASVGYDRAGQPDGGLAQQEPEDEDEHQRSPEQKRSRILDEDFFRPPPPPPMDKGKGREKPPRNQSEPEQRLRFKVSAVESPTGKANVHIVIEDMDDETRYYTRDHSPPPSPPSPPNNNNMPPSSPLHDQPPRIPPRYVIALRAIWRMKYLVAKKKFRQARNPYDLHDITERVSESEKQQLTRLRKVQARMERMLGPPRPSLLAPHDERMMTLAQRLQMVEMRMAELDKKADLIVQMATQLADRVGNNTRRKYMNNSFLK